MIAEQKKIPVKYVPHSYQVHAEEHIMDNLGAGLFLDMGLGKTVITGTALNRLMFEECDVLKALVIAPKRVADHTWSAEFDKWEHLNHIRVSKILGSVKERIAAVRADADVYVTNRENVAWLVAYLGGNWPYDAVVIDELTSFKNPKSIRFKALRSIRPKIRRLIGLTGTPAPNGLIDLWAQLYLLDRGERLGATLKDYRGKYFTKNPYKPFAKYEVLTESDDLVGKGYYEKKIYNKISDICISMRSEDYLDLPDKIFNDVPIILDAMTMARYEAFEREQVLALLDDDGQITAVNAGVLANKLLQFANGAIYDDRGVYHDIHTEKLNELEEIIDQNYGKNILIFYSYDHDRIRIAERFKNLKPVKLSGSKEIDRWNAGEIGLAMVHPASGAWGLNLQEGGHIIVFFGLVWSLELYLQAIKRLHRQGQIHNVIINRLIVQGTYDENVVDALNIKDGGQKALLDSVRVIVKKHVPNYRLTA